MFLLRQFASTNLIQCLDLLGDLLVEGEGIFGADVGRLVLFEQVKSVADAQQLVENWLLTRVCRESDGGCIGHGAVVARDSTCVAGCEYCESRYMQTGWRGSGLYSI